MRGHRWFASAALVGLVLAGCGGGGDDDEASDETTTTEETEDETTTTTAAAAAGDAEYTERVLDFANALIADMGDIQALAVAPDAFSPENSAETFTQIRDVVQVQRDGLVDVEPEDEGSELHDQWTAALQSVDDVLTLVDDTLELIETGGSFDGTAQEFGAQFQDRFSAMGDAVGAFVTAAGEQD